MSSTKLTEAQILTKCKKLLKEQPSINSTEMAQAIAGGYQGNLYPIYADILLTINKLKERGQLPRPN